MHGHTLAACGVCKKTLRSEVGGGARYKTARIEVKADPESGIYEGYGSTFEPPERHDSHGDVINPSFFDEVIAKVASGQKRVKMLWQHDPMEPMGVLEELRADKKGLYFRAKIIPTQANRDRLEMIRLGAIDGASIGYETTKSRKLSYKTPWGAPVRELLKGDLWEISPVTFPSNIYAEIGAKCQMMETRSGLMIPADSVCTCHLHKDQDMTDPEVIEVSPGPEVATEEKAGRVLSRKNEETLTRLRESLLEGADMIGELLRQLEGQTDPTDLEDEGDAGELAELELDQDQNKQALAIAERLEKLFSVN